MKRTRLNKQFLFALLGLIIILGNGSCKNFGVPEYELRVTMDAGVQGIPQGGTYSYRELTEVIYSYAPLDGNHTAEVLVNATRRDTNGTIILYNHTDVVVRVFDIRGVWDVTMQRPATSTEDPINFKLTFTGSNLLGGEFTDDRGYRGLWSITGQSLIISYNDWLNYILTGTIPVMSGTWTGEGVTASWRAIRQ